MGVVRFTSDLTEKHVRISHLGVNQKSWISVLKRSNECDSVENSQGQSKTTEVANSVIAEGTFSTLLFHQI